MRLAAGLAALLLATCARAATQAPGVSIDGPVDLDRLLQLTRLREATTAKLVYTYTFQQTTTEEDLDERGRLKDRTVSVYQVVPTPKGTERHLVSRDGRRPTAAEERKQERRNAALEQRFAKMQARAQKEAERRRAEQAAARPDAAPTPAKPTAPRPAPATTAPTPAPHPVAATAPPTPPGAQTVSTETVSEPSAPGAPSAPPAVALPPVPATAPSLAPIPPCDFDDPLASVRPPLPGSVTRSAATGPQASDEQRRKRENASDYSLFELLNLTDHEYAGACTWEGRPMHVVAFRPPATFDAMNPVERVVTAMAGSILIDGGDLEVARAAGATIAPITWGAGMVKLKSANVVLEYARIHGEIWLPKRDVFEFQSRVIFANDRQRVTHEFDDFEKATVGIETEFGGPSDAP